MRTLSHERQSMKAIVEQAAVGFELHFTATSRDRLGPVAYAARLGDARFALVPGGNSPETIRLYDALEMGAVPIMLRGPFVRAAGALNGPPFLLLDDWTQFAVAYAPFADGSPGALAALDALQNEVIVWWEAFKRTQQRKLRGLIDAVLDH
jgi:Exostosin family